MSLEWVLILAGVLLLALAARPIQRYAARPAHEDPTLHTPTPAATAPAPSAPPAPQKESQRDPLEMPWLDSLLGTPETPPREPLDDAAEIASVLRFWLSEERP